MQAPAFTWGYQGLGGCLVGILQCSLLALISYACGVRVLLVSSGPLQ